MSTRPNLDFFAHVPTRQEVARARLTEQRGHMYTWRSDDNTSRSSSGSIARAPVFDPLTGARCARRRIYNPTPAQRAVEVVRRGNGSKRQIYVNDADSSSSVEGGEEGDETIWDSAAGSTGDRRRMWRQTNFAFSPGHFSSRGGDAAFAATSTAGGAYMPYIHDTILFCKPSLRPSTGANKEKSGAAVRPSSSSVVLAVTCNAAEARGRELRAAEDAKSGELLSLSSLSPAPRAPQRRSYNYASSPTHCFDDGDGAARTATATAGATSASGAAAAAGGGGGAMGGSVDNGAARPFVASLDEDMINLGDTKLMSTKEGPPKGLRDEPIPTPTTAMTLCDTVGPTLASRQRALSMAEGVYRDLVAGQAQRSGTAGALRLAAVPTCELAYSLRASYMHGSHSMNGPGGSEKAGAASASRHRLPRSATNSASLPSRTVGSHSAASPNHRGQQRHANGKGQRQPQRPASVNTAMSSSGMQGSSLYDRGPHRRTVTAVGINGLVGSSFFEEADDGTSPVPFGAVASPPAAAAALAAAAAAAVASQPALLREIPAVAVSAADVSSPMAAAAAAARRGSVLRPSPPPPLPAQPIRAFSSERSLSSSSDAVSRTMSAASPLGCCDATMTTAPANMTAPPTLSRFELELELAQGASGIVLHSTNKSSPLTLQQQQQQRRSSRFTVSPKSETYCEHPSPPQQSPPQPQPPRERHTHLADSLRLADQPVTGGSHRPRRRHRHQQQQQHRAGSGRAASRKSRRGQSSRQSSRSPHASRHLGGEGNDDDTRRLPAEAKETRVYAVRVRATFTNADASPSPKSRDPPRRGVPVLLPEDWQPYP